MTYSTGKIHTDRPERLPSLAIALSFLALLLTSPLVSAQSTAPAYIQTVFVAGSDNTAFNLRFVNLLKEQLGTRVVVRGYSEELSAAQPGTLVVTLGSAALSRVQMQSPRPPTLALMIDGQQFASYLGREGPALSAIYYDAPLVRQALLGKVILPHSNRIAVLVRPGEEPRYDHLIAEMASYDTDVRVFPVKGEDSLIATLARALSFGDFLLAIPDSAIYNPRTIKHILLTAYRRNRIVIGPSRAFVRAGVLASSYTPLEVVASLASNHIRQYLESGQMPPPQYPEHYNIEVNNQVAQSLNIPVPTPEETVDKLNSLIGQASEDANQ